MWKKSSKELGKCAGNKANKEVGKSVCKKSSKN